MRDTSLLIVGTGAMACLFAARLSPHARVTLLGGWAAGIEALSRHGVRLEADDGPVTGPVHATSDPATCRGARLALVLAKAWQTPRVATQLAQCLAPDGVALTLQNGLGNVDQLQEALGAGRAALGVTTAGATLLGPGHVREGGRGPTYLPAGPGLGRLENLFLEAGLEVRRAGDMQGTHWGKLAVNAGINPVTALLRLENGALAGHPEGRALATAAAQEVAAVAAARGISLPFSDAAEETLAVARRTARNRSSMYQDILRGAPTEVDAICGAVVHQGEDRGVPTPVNRSLWRTVRILAGGVGVAA